MFALEIGPTTFLKCERLARLQKSSLKNSLDPFLLRVSGYLSIYGLELE